MKYIRHSVAGMVMWRAGHGRPNHVAMQNALNSAFGGEAVSAGFAMLIAERPGIKCFGDSGGLGLESLPEDTDILIAQLEEV